MIYDKIENGARYEKLGTEIAVALRAARAMTRDTETGRYDFDDGVFANVMSAETKPTDNAVFETHRRYLDLQIVLDGAETVLIESPLRLTIAEEYSAAKDIAFYTGKGSPIAVRAGEFYLVYPSDAHAPTLRADSKIVKKAVFKIPYREEIE